MHASKYKLTQNLGGGIEDISITCIKEVYSRYEIPLPIACDFFTKTWVPPTSISFKLALFPRI